MTKDYPWRTGRKCVFKNYIHLVFVTKYRKNVLTLKMIERIKELIKETCDQMDCEFVEMNGEGDHIHFMVNLHPKWAVSNFAGKIKGKTSYYLRLEFWEQIKDKLWGEHFWSPSYCVVSTGGATIETVRKYIEDQRVPTEEKHVKKSKALTQC